MSDRPQLIQVDMGPYASLLYKFDLFHNEEFRLDSQKGLKFLHFNIAGRGHEPKTFSKRFLKIWQSRTVAVLALSPHGIKKIAHEFLNLAPDTKMTIPMAVGVTFVSVDDNYSKEIGRDKSVRAMKEIDLEIQMLSINATHINILLAPLEGVQLTLRLNKKSGFSNVIGQLTGRAEDRP